MTNKVQSLSVVVSMAVASLLACGAAQAQDNIFKLGAIRYTTNSSTTGIKGAGVPAGADAETGDATTLILVVERTLTPNIGIELVLGVPPRIKSKATGSVAFLGDNVLSAKNVAPTLLVNYYFGEPANTLRPYLGVGLNYTRFTSVKSSLAPKVSMSDSLGAAIQVGVNFAFNKQSGLFASVARVDVQSDVVAVGSTVLTTHIDFKPVTYSMGAYYKF
jgi:outer membrane protein